MRDTFLKTVKDYTPLRIKRCGEVYFGHCPFCKSGRKEAFVVNNCLNRFKCLDCKVSGMGKDEFMTMIKGLRNNDAVAI